MNDVIDELHRRGLIAQSTEDHASIAAAIAAHDPDRAAAAMAQHLAHIKESSKRTMASQKFGVVS